MLKCIQEAQGQLLKKTTQKIQGELIKSIKAPHRKNTHLTQRKAETEKKRDQAE